ncbi:acyl carrier protein [Streptomyces abikoensis]|uniref:Acyl carrier protein n=1 Tax=Streptomyces abikoensis TaxID=97398 RepID=A0ABW7SX91_9ACTN
MRDTDTVVVDLEDLRRTVAAVLDVEVADVTDDARFVEDLGGDSLLALEVIVVLEKKYGVTFDEAEVKSLTSLPETHSLLGRKLAGL